MYGCQYYRKNCKKSQKTVFQYTHYATRAHYTLKGREKKKLNYVVFNISPFGSRAYLSLFQLIKIGKILHVAMKWPFIH